MPHPPIHRRHLLRLAAGGLLAGLASACGARRIREDEAPVTDPAALRLLHAGGGLASRPGSAATGSQETGLRRLGLGDANRDGAIYVPSGYRSGWPSPLVLSLHGASGSGRGGLDRLRALAEERGIILLAPDSRARTWDVVGGRYGPDVEFIDRALALVFARYSVDPARVAVEGFSDGASYALSLGLTNGDLFSRVVAFSPGFVEADRRQGAPRLFVSHGTGDRILPIDRCGRRIVREARKNGYDVRFVEFDGGHTVPPEIAREAVDWLLSSA